MANENGNTKKVGIYKNSIISFLAITLFLLNGYEFIKLNGIAHPLLYRLFNIFSFLSILIFIYHKNNKINNKEDFSNQAI